jgi:hypothetical protein
MSAASTAGDPGFARTRWSTVTQVGREAVGANALAELCTRYRYPVYAYVRCCGRTPAAARITTTRFLDEVQRGAARHAPSAERQFRRFLLERLEAYLARDEHPPITEAAGEPDPLEVRYARGATCTDSPVQAFQRGFAVDVLLVAFARLRDEAEATGHGGMYATLAPYLARDPLPHEYDALAATLRVRPLTIAVALKRLRQRLQELAGEALADTVSSAAELAGEQAAMLAAFRATG